MRAESVLVVRDDYTTATFACSAADFDQNGTVTVRELVQGYQMATFVPGTWRTCQGFGPGGLSLYVVTPQNIAQYARYREARTA